MKKTKQELFNMAVSDLWLASQRFNRASVLECSKSILLRYLPNACEIFQNEFSLLATHFANIVITQKVLAQSLKEYRGDSLWIMKK